MVEPVTIFIAVTSFLSLLTTGIDWIKKRMDSQSVSPVPLVIAASTYPPTSFSPSIDENIRKVEYENSKSNKESLASYESDDYKSSSNSGFPISVIFVILLILSVMGFIVYRKQNKLKENQLKFRQNDSPPSPTTTQTDFNLTVV